ncbi:glycosyltransferase [Sediminibacterium goheungense]|uniref:GT2 family glycosyltransferase n=1 Tax=Sediminibacterium goheungense TaxID=1086393 RepID=A0A4R6IU72_9BACT|nr:glycosyltransferase [Sediminibacterium goheungense]TDO25867.1 GT2 family glycosyltransferase [Sediminibacterium goheungense]
MNGISVITICFNNLTDVQKTCASVDAQTMPPQEHWIINGSTNSDIADWLEHTLQPAYRKWINERDKGIADAFNKGIRKANAPITHLLNAGDIYAGTDVLATVSSFFQIHPTVQWISGNIELIRGGEKVIIGKPFEKGKLYRGMRSVSHPTWFVKKEVYQRVGYFKSEYKIAMDYDMMCRLGDEAYQYLPKTIAIFDDTGVSSTQYLRSLAENKTVYESYFGKSVKLAFWQLRLKLLYYLLQSSIGKWLFLVKKKMGLENW